MREQLGIDRSSPGTRLVALDVDGTLIGDGVVSQRVRAAVERAAEVAHLVLCTARSRIDVRPLLTDLDVPGMYALCCNGAVILDAGGALIAERLFDPRAALASLRALLPGAVFVVERGADGDYVTRGYSEKRVVRHQTVVENVTTLAVTPVTRLVAGWLDHEHAELVTRMSGVRLPGADYVLDHTFPWVMVSAHGVTKANSLELLRRELGIPRSRTMAVGDGFNDIDMLIWAAHGVAMGQAPESVKRVANAITGTVDEDGLADAIDRWFDSE